MAEKAGYDVETIRNKVDQVSDQRKQQFEGDTSQAECLDSIAEEKRERHTDKQTDRQSRRKEGEREGE